MDAPLVIEFTPEESDEDSDGNTHGLAAGTAGEP